MKLSILSMFLLVASCHKEEPMPPIPVDPPKVFEKVWKTRHYEAPLEKVGCQNAYLYKDVYLTIGDDYSHPDPSIYAYDTKTGTLKWRWKHSGRLQKPGFNIEGKDKILVLSNSLGILAFDISTQQLLWEDIFNDYNQIGENRQTINGDYVYTSAINGDFYGSVDVVRYHIATGKKEVICKVPIEDGWSPAISPPAFWVDENRDTIMVFINGKSHIDFSPQNSPTDLWAFNLNTNKVQWKIENIMEVPTNLLSPPVVYNDDVIFGGDWSVYSVDIPTGKVNWRTQYPEMGRFGNFNRTGLLLVGDKVYGNPDGLDIFCINAINGSKIWHEKSFEKGAANCSPKMLYNDGMLITSSIGFGSVLIYDAITGKLIHKEYSPTNYHIDVLYDKATEMYFVQDFAYAVGFRINKPK